MRLNCVTIDVDTTGDASVEGKEINSSEVNLKFTLEKSAIILLSKAASRKPEFRKRQFPTDLHAVARTHKTSIPSNDMWKVYRNSHAEEPMGRQRHGLQFQCEKIAALEQVKGFD
jgi:hypothetical protein